MIRQATRSLWRALLAALCALALWGCQSAPQAPPAKDAKVAALQRAGFAPGADDAWELNLGVKLLFDPGVDTLSREGQAALDQVARTLTQIGVERVQVEGYTDNTGSAQYNQELSKRRADSVAEELIRGGLRDDLVERHGRGFDKPVADNRTAEGRAQNRRVVVTVLVN